MEQPLSLPSDTVLTPASERWWRGDREELPESIWPEIERHAMLPWIYYQGKPRPGAPKLRRAWQRQVAFSMTWLDHLEHTCRTLVDLGVQCLVFKGAALAQTLYPDPALRPFGDIDLWVPEHARQQTEKWLIESGWQQLPVNDGDLVTRQSCWQPAAGHLGLPTYDLHWRPSNRPGLDQALGFNEVWQEKLVTSSGCHTPSHYHSLLLAVLHLHGHHRLNERLIWLLDLQLLWGELAPLQRQGALEQLAQMGAALTLRRALHLGHRYFEVLSSTELPPPPPTSWQPPNPSGRQQLWRDIRTTRGWSQRLRLAWQHAFPGHRFMRSRHPSGPLAWWYLRRLLRGAIKLVTNR